MTRKRKTLWIVICLLVVAMSGIAVWLRTQMEQRLAHRLHGHQHCIKIAGSAFRAFASDHSGKYPTHTNGWGDALLLMAKSNYVDVAFICGPKDDGRVLRAALQDGMDVPEELCSRVYIQGLSDDMKSIVCMMYDRKSHPGGDHFYGRGRPIREYIDNTGFMGTVTDDRWPEFSRQQVEILVELGFSREEAEAYFPEAAK